MRQSKKDETARELVRLDRQRQKVKRSAEKVKKLLATFEITFPPRKRS